MFSSKAGRGGAAGGAVGGAAGGGSAGGVDAAGAGAAGAGAGVAAALAVVVVAEGDDVGEVGDGAATLLLPACVAVCIAAAVMVATGLAGSDAPTLGYVSVYPLTMILRIVSAEVLVLLLAR